MAVTFTPTLVKSRSVGDTYEHTVDIACTGTPTVGGDALTAAQLGLDTVESVEVLSGASNAGATVMVPVAVIHGAGTALLQVLIAFMVQGTAGAANAMLAYTGSTANLTFRVRAQGKSRKAVAA